MSILLYLVGGWFLLNILFTVGMYFRPKRKKPVGFAQDRAPMGQIGDTNRPSNAGDPAQAGTDSSISRRPALPIRLLLFGLWLNDNRHSA